MMLGSCMAVAHAACIIRASRLLTYQPLLP
jgi:hypothetical protein